MPKVNIEIDNCFDCPHIDLPEMFSELSSPQCEKTEKTLQEDPAPPGYGSGCITIPAWCPLLKK